MNAAVIRNPKINSVIPFGTKEKTKKDSGNLMSKKDYFEMIDKSLKEIEEGKIVKVSAEEMRSILSE